jgi:hypothetical protein
MGGCRAVCALFIVLSVAGSAVVEGQSPLVSRAIAVPAVPPSGESPAQILASLLVFRAEYEAWQPWFAEWRNRREPGWLSSRERRPAPVPPAWLADACATPVDGEDTPLVAACRAFRELNRDLADDAAAVASQQLAQARAQLEAPEKSIWWSRVHLDAIWPMTQSGSNAFGIAGVHVAVPIAGRFQVFVTPGAILMRLPSEDGTSALTAATDWGFSFKVADFRLPGFRRANTLHFNMARVWLLGQAANVKTPGDMYVAGFSITLKQR